ncbi:MAG: hypothetical protein IPK76_21995 [Lewinellaceae bacterium]|nr:hypothetical protein [Lewinellaceae bacterium]
MSKFEQLLPPEATSSVDRQQQRGCRRRWRSARPVATIKLVFLELEKEDVPSLNARMRKIRKTNNMAHNSAFTPKYSTTTSR